jgi:hypothetical protein
MVTHDQEQIDPHDVPCPKDIFGEHGHTTHNTKHGRIVPQTVSSRPPPSEAWVQSPASVCGTCGGQTGSGTRFLPEYLGLTVSNMMPLVPHGHSTINDATQARLLTSSFNETHTQY